jgi:hypothetical protein
VKSNSFLKPLVLFFVFLIPGICCAQQTAPKIITRNTKAPIIINGIIIKQDKRNIGYVRLLEQFNDGRPVRVYQVFILNGTQIATAFSFGKTSHEWMVTILNSPEITFQVSSKEGSDIRDIAAILISHGYL